MKESKRADLEDQRQQLVSFIEQNAPHGSSNNSVTIIFDGKQEVFGGMSSPAAKIIFSQGESADDKIRELVAMAGNAKNIVVVSDDRDIQYAVRALGAKSSSVQAFLKKGNTERGKGRTLKKAVTNRNEKYITKCDESKINAEMGKIWLKSDNKDKQDS